MSAETGRSTIPPVMLIRVEDAKDIMVARNTARRAALLLGFSAASRAQIASAVAVLVSMVLKAEAQQTINLHGLRSGARTGIQVTCEAPWLASISPENALVALRSKLGDMMDELGVEPGPPPHIRMVLWLSPERTQSPG